MTSSDFVGKSCVVSLQEADIVTDCIGSTAGISPEKANRTALGAIFAIIGLELVGAPPYMSEFSEVVPASVGAGAVSAVMLGSFGALF